MKKSNLWRRKRSTSARQLTIKNRQPWRLGFLLLVLASAAVYLAYYQGRNISGHNPELSMESMQELKERVALLTAERDRLSTIANAAESQISMERATQQQLAEQVKGLMNENTRLKEDLAFFEKLLPANVSQGVTIRHLRTETLAPNQIQYRLLLMHGSKGEQNFVGDLQLAVTVTREGNGGNDMMIFPQRNATDINRFKLSFKYYQRVEGILTLPEGVTAKTVQARVLEKGQIRAQQTVNL